MKKEQLAFLIGGFAFGILVGYGLFNAISSGPLEAGSMAAGMPSPAGPGAPTQVAGGGSAPMTGQINELKRRLQENPQDLELLLSLGDVYRQVQMWDQASEYYQRAVEVDPSNMELVTNLAHLFQDSGRCDQAVGYYERAIESEPGNPDLLTDLGVCYRALGSYEKALELFDRANGFAPEHWQSVFNKIVVVGLDLGRLQEADATMERLLQIKPDAPGLDRLREALEERRQAPQASG